MSLDSSTVYVTGSAGGTGTQSDWATIAYDTATGEEHWVSIYNGAASRTDVPRALVLDRRL
jgi:hypothetical protein